MCTQNKALTWIGWVLTGLIGLLMVFSATMKLMNPPELSEQVVKIFGYPKDLILGLGIVEVCCVVLYLIPRTAILGAVLLTGPLPIIGGSGSPARVLALVERS